MNTGDTAFLLLSAALVMLMTPGLALFYGGMVRRKNTLGTIMQSMIVIALVSVEWLFVGYSLTFGPDVKGLIGDLSWFALRGVGLEPYPDYGATVPHQAFMIYQGMFAVIAPALITGAFAERIKFSAFLLFIGLWSLLVYYPVAHWVWGVGGWVRGLGALDFAGGAGVRLTPGGGPLHQRVRRDPYGGIGGDALLDVRGMGAPRQADRPGGGFRRGRRAGRHHPGGGNGLFFGNPKLLVVQAGAAGVSAVYAFVVTWVLFKILDKAVGLRVPEEEEVMGLDLTQHGEAGYNW